MNCSIDDKIAKANIDAALSTEGKTPRQIGIDMENNVNYFLSNSGFVQNASNNKKTNFMKLITLLKFHLISCHGLLSGQRN